MLMSVVGSVCVRMDVSVLHCAWVSVGVDVEAPLPPTPEKTDGERRDHKPDRSLGPALRRIR